MFVMPRPEVVAFGVVTVVGVAFVVPRSDPAPAGEELGAFLATRLAKYKIPKEFVFVDSLPRTAYGKVVKGELAAMYLTKAGG